tara:strand:+ start:2680 stop:3585 length:906 start_codon:yes stop_codon:yes gene_type:complete
MTMFNTQKISFLLALIVALSFTACGSGVKSIPDEPSAAVQTVNDEINAGNCSIIWHAMPASYQADVNAIVQLAGTKVDAEIYDKTFSFLSRLAEVVDKQKAFIINAELISELPAEELAKIETAWSSIIGFVECIATSSISSSAGLQAFDGEVFFNETFSDLFKYSKDLASIAGEELTDFDIANLEFDSVKTLEISDTTAVVEITLVNGDAETLDLTRVENRWVPTELHTEWSEGIADSKEELKAFSFDDLVENKSQIMGLFTTADILLTQFDSAQTQEEFNQAIEGSMMQIGVLVMQFMDF